MYLRTTAGGGSQEGSEAFALYRGSGIAFTIDDRRRLLDHGVRLAYIRMADQQKFQQAIEAQLNKIVTDPSIAASEASAIVYETSVALIDEMVNDPELVLKSTRLENVSRAVTSLVIRDRKSFSHLFNVSHHDFYTATHLVNVATWMVPLAYALGYRSSEELTQICEAGMLHDIGKLHISADLLNKKDRLTDEDWEIIRQHPQRGYENLEKYEHVDALSRRIALEHHERLDGTGYPRGLRNGDIHMFSRICSVVDSFDAMTAFRPFKSRTLSPAEAIGILQKESPDKYDAEVVDAWLALVKSARPDLPVESMLTKTDSGDGQGSDRRKEYRFHCSGRAHLLVQGGGNWMEQAAIQVTMHNVSSSGVGFLSPVAIALDQRVRLYLNLRGWGNKKYLEGHTVRCRQYPDGWFEIGVQLGPLAPAEPEAILCPVIKGRKTKSGVRMIS